MENDKLVRLSDAVDEIESLLDVYNEDEGNIVLRHAVKCVKHIPAMDAVEVVRCKDCANWIKRHKRQPGDYEGRWCNYLQMRTRDDFCCKGFVRREEEHNAAD